MTTETQGAGLTLLPCPFGCCPDDAFDSGSAAVLTDCNDLGWFALCTQCSAVGPTTDSESEARKAWNRRPSSQAGAIKLPVSERRLSTMGAQEREALERDAARWRALVGCTRVRVLGSAGLKDPMGEYAHIGLELWTRYALPDGTPRSYCDADRATFTQFADFASAVDGRLSTQPSAAEAIRYRLVRLPNGRSAMYSLDSYGRRNLAAPIDAEFYLAPSTDEREEGKSA